uniref:Uncharacterized protein n=1 Tax=Hyaloperonospora arabidopsidis (strain Emoy2) TaxID=559515 RepID=M4C1M3_HYAAE
MAQPFPIKQDRIEDVPLFYLNSDRVLRYKPAVEGVYYVKARMADVYLGSYNKRRIDCPFNITVAKFSEAETRHLSGRQRLHEFVVAWWEIVQSGGKDVMLNSMATSIDGMVDEQMEAMRKDYQHVKVPNVSWTEMDK